MQRMPEVKAVMTPFPHAVLLDAPLAEAQSFMRGHGIRHLPVIDGGKLVGIITDRDIKLVIGPDFDSPPMEELTVGDAFQPEVFVVDLNMPLADVLEGMTERHIGSALVTRKGKLAGVFTVTDACRAYAADLRERFGPTDDIVA